MQSGAIKIGRCTLDTRNRSLSNQEGRQSPLTFKSAQLIQILAEHAGNVVNRDLLIESVWGDNFQVGSIRLYDEIWKIRQAFDELGVTDVRVLTVPRLGYCLEIDDVSESANQLKSSESSAQPTLPPRLLAAWLLALPMVALSLRNLLEKQQGGANNSKDQERADETSRLGEMLAMLNRHEDVFGAPGDLVSLLSQLEMILKYDAGKEHAESGPVENLQDVSQVNSRKERMNKVGRRDFGNKQSRSRSSSTSARRTRTGTSH